MTNKVLKYPEGSRIIILSPIIHGEKGTHKDVLDSLRKDGFTRVRINGENHDLSEDIVLEKNKKSNIDIIVDRLVLKNDDRSRLFESIETATKMADGKVVINIDSDKEIVMSEKYACVHCDFSLPELEPRLFSFNSPYGACPECKGLGVKLHVSEDLLIPDKNKSILDGAIKTLSMDDNTALTAIKTVAEYNNIDLNIPISKMDKDKLNILLYGSDNL